MHDGHVKKTYQREAKYKLSLSQLHSDFPSFIKKTCLKTEAIHFWYFFCLYSIRDLVFRLCGRECHVSENHDHILQIFISKTHLQFDGFYHILNFTRHPRSVCTSGCQKHVKIWTTIEVKVPLAHRWPNFISSSTRVHLIRERICGSKGAKGRAHWGPGNAERYTLANAKLWQQLSP